MLKLPTAEGRTDRQADRETKMQRDGQKYGQTDRATKIFAFVLNFMQACKKLPTAKRNKQRQVNSLSSVSTALGTSASASECELTEWYAHDLYIHYSIYIYAHTASHRIAYALQLRQCENQLQFSFSANFVPLYFFCETSWRQGVLKGGVARGVLSWGAEKGASNFGGFVRCVGRRKVQLICQPSA